MLTVKALGAGVRFCAVWFGGGQEILITATTHQWQAQACLLLQPIAFTSCTAHPGSPLFRRLLQHTVRIALQTLSFLALKLMGGEKFCYLVQSCEREPSLKCQQQKITMGLLVLLNYIYFCADK